MVIYLTPPKGIRRESISMLPLRWFEDLNFLSVGSVCIAFVTVTAWMPNLKAEVTLKVCNGKAAGEELFLGKDIQVEFSWCPRGTFVMGSPESEDGRDRDESQVEVRLTKGYWISQTEVTQRLWTKVMISTPWSGINGVPNLPDLPATNVSYADAHRFCIALTRKARNKGLLPEDWNFCLPTEAQWEYACRAGTSTAYFFGDSPNKLGLYAWFYGNRRPENPELVAHPVGQLLPNDWGIYDMLGNVEEWCVDVWDEEYEGGEDPVCAPIGDPSRELYIQRGGHFEAGRAHCRSASRGFSSPEAGGEYAGFRIVLIEDVR